MTKFATVIVLLSGIFWTITYIALVYRGFKDKSYGMPLAALAAEYCLGNYLLNNLPTALRRHDGNRNKYHLADL